jgi:excisionase family DNA binding protein
MTFCRLASCAGPSGGGAGRGRKEWVVVATTTMCRLSRALSELDDAIRQSAPDDLVAVSAALKARAYEAKRRLKLLEVSCLRCRTRTADRPAGGAPEEAEDLCVADAARELGVNAWRIYRLAKAGKLPGAYRLGRSLRVPRQAIETVRTTPYV